LDEEQWTKLGVCVRNARAWVGLRPYSAYDKKLAKLNIREVRRHNRLVMLAQRALIEASQHVPKLHRRNCDCDVCFGPRSVALRKIAAMLQPIARPRSGFEDMRFPHRYAFENDLRLQIKDCLTSTCKLDVYTAEQITNQISIQLLNIRRKDSSWTRIRHSRNGNGANVRSDF
jgi:hypothetical protein